MKNHNQYNGGIADVWYSGTSRDLWVEYKFIVVPKRNDTVIVPGLSPLQLEWLRGRAKDGRHVGVVIGCKEGGVYLHASQWERLSVREFRVQIKERRAVATLITSLVNC